MNLRHFFVIGFLLAINASSFGAVTSSDITLQPVITTNLPIIAPNIGYANALPVGPTQIPLYTPFDSGTTGWWDNMVQELLQARVSVVALEDRGWAYWGGSPVPTGGGNMDPRRLSNLFAALNRANASSLISCICFFETDSVTSKINDFYGTTGSPDLSNQTYWNTVWWQNILQPWFNTVPSGNWYKIGGRPVIYIWSVNFFSNVKGNEVPLLNYLEAQVKATYGEDPLFVLDQSWFGDPAVASDPAVIGNNSWFSTTKGFAMNSLNGFNCGVVIPGYGLNPVTIPRNGVSGTGSLGDTLRTCLDDSYSEDADLMFAEGWNDQTESMGFYRSKDADWSFPNQYINIMRQYLDLRTVTLRLEAEGADAFSPSTSGQTVFRTDGLKVRTLTGSSAGWAVTGMPAGGWIQFTNVFVSPGNYKFPVQYSSTAAHTLQLSVDGVALPSVSVPSTGNVNTFNTVYLGSKALTAGTHNVKLTWVDGGVDVDWIFMKKYDPMMSFKSSLTNCYLTANLGGNDTIVSNRTAAGVWENFSVDDLSGAGTVSSGDAVNLQVYDGLYITAETNGGSTVSVDRLVPGVWEKWTIQKIGGSGALANGNQVAFKSDDGTHYLTVVNGTTVNDTGTSIGAAQTFTINISAQ